MISVQNHPQLLSGNKHWLLLFTTLCLFSCSPRIKKVVTKSPESAVEKEAIKPEVKFTQANIALLVPFHLNEINLKKATKTDVEKSAMAIDFYQGFKLGVDSAAAKGLNFKLKVFDTQDDGKQIYSLIEKGDLQGSNLIVGPVFPEGLKQIRNYSFNRGIPVINPLAATHPSEFDNPNQISIVNNIELHAGKMGDYISGNFNPENTIVVLINPKTPADEVMAQPVRAFFTSSKKQFPFQEYASVFTLETRLNKAKKYVVIVSSSDSRFVVPTLDKLLKMKNAGLKVDLFGHPDWAKQNYNTDKLQALNTIITSSYKVDYKSTDVNNFIKKYRKSFNFEPGEYAFKGFDIGFYFAKLLAEHGPDYVKYLTKEKYKGLHNSFSFYHDKRFGYINKDLMLLRYRNFALNIVE